eukprot:Rhum_TRINITY_DN9613_c0_g1::Rhum_TRINITY_DN9613_c0_g1_i1::g.34358::m.34358
MSGQEGSGDSASSPGGGGGSGGGGTGTGGPLLPHLIRVNVRVTFNGFCDVKERLRQRTPSPSTTGEEAAAGMAAALHTMSHGLKEAVVIDKRGVARLKQAVLNFPAVQEVAALLQTIGVCLVVKPICRGQVVSDHFVRTGIKSGEVVHCVVSPEAQHAASAASSPAADAGEAAVGAASPPPDGSPRGGGGGAGEAAGGDEPPRGFDRLLEAGFTAEDVALMRVQFRSSQSVSDGEGEAGQLAQEDRWLDAQGGASPSGAGTGGAASGAASPLGVGGASVPMPQIFDTLLDEGLGHGGEPQVEQGVIVEVDPPENPSLEDSVGFGFVLGFFLTHTGLLFIQSRRHVRLGVALGVAANFVLGCLAVVLLDMRDHGVVG